MSFRDKLSDKLKLPDNELALLPNGYQIVGKIVLIKLDKRLLKHKRMIGKKVLEVLPYLDTVCLALDIRKTIRKPRIEVIAGKKKTQTLNKEHGCSFLLDVADIMWSQGNKNEKQRMIDVVNKGETVADMFSGIGYFSILIAKHCHPRKVYAMDINPKAAEYLRRNIWLNGVESVVEVLEGDCRMFAPALEGLADRVLMGYLFDTEKFLPDAIRIAKKKAIIHFHRIVKEDEIDSFGKFLEKDKRLKVVETRKIKSYAPKVWHMVYDLCVTKS
jgi:tRNA wybutosine-synthesizing protein 2